MVFRVGGSGGSIIWLLLPVVVLLQLVLLLLLPKLVHQLVQRLVQQGRSGGLWHRAAAREQLLRSHGEPVEVEIHLVTDLGGGGNGMAPVGLPVIMPSGVAPRDSTHHQDQAASELTILNCPPLLC